MAFPNPERGMQSLIYATISRVLNHRVSPVQVSLENKGSKGLTSPILLVCESQETSLVG